MKPECEVRAEAWRAGEFDPWHYERFEQPGRTQPAEIDRLEAGIGDKAAWPAACRPHRLSDFRTESDVPPSQLAETNAASREFRGDHDDHPDCGDRQTREPRVDTDQCKDAKQRVA
jgi:hypothetical protein